MASSYSISSGHKSFEYDVYLSFRGEDTRKNFVDHLFYALVRQGIKTHINDIFLRGEPIANHIIEAIENSKFLVIVFSKNYASSSLCLNELVKIMECHDDETTEQKALPLYYDVAPSEIRKQSGEVGKALARYKDEVAAGRWREALTKAAMVAGWDLMATADGHESQFIKKIVKDISSLLRRGEVTNKWGEVTNKSSDVLEIHYTPSVPSSSISSVHVSIKYDVYLTSRAKDTSENFVDHLYEALQRQGIHTYREDLNHTYSEHSISIGSKFLVLVFSKNYASSPLCLNKLVEILECHKTKEQIAYPVFFDVTPTEVRKQSEAVKEAFAQNTDDVAVGKWREGLKEAADLDGWELSNTANGYEAQAIKRIVEFISLKLRSINFRSDSMLIGMETRLQDFKSYLEMGLNDVRIIGISGMEGCGKTTLARAVFDEISVQFEGKSFVQNVKGISKDSLSSLKLLQEKVLSDVFNDQHITVNSVYDGKKMMKRMSYRKVLVVLDDVEYLEQLEALCGEPYWFGSGSRIIVTTREKKLLIAHQVQWIHDVLPISHLEAMCLFSRCAFGRESPSQRYEELSREVVPHAAGIPLTIKILGSYLCGKDMIDWVDALARLKKISVKEPLKKLELSYENLNDHTKEVFLDVACFLNGVMKQEAIRILESCGFHARADLSVLEEYFLIAVDDYECLVMHACLKEMGRNIVRRWHPTEPNRHSRLWAQEEIEKVLANDLGTEATKAIAVDAPVKLDSEIVTKGFGSMKQLRLLRMVSEMEDFSHVNEVGESFPDALNFLSWFGYPHCYLPKAFEGNNLVTLEMPYSRIVRLWGRGESEVNLHNLKFLNLNHSKLKKLDLEPTPNLKGLSLEECHDLMELHMPVQLQKLGSLKLSHSKLRTLDLWQTPNLEVLKLKECRDVENFQIPNKYVNLRSLNLGHIKLKILDLEETLNLETLHIEECYDLEFLYMPIESVKLRSVNVSHLKLKDLRLRGTLNLETLHIEECHDLEYFTMRFQYLSPISLKLSHIIESKFIQMPIECVRLMSLDLSHSKLMTLDLRQTPNLERLDLQDCNHLKDLSMPIGGLRRLVFLNLSGCSRITSFSFIKDLKALEVLCLARLYVNNFPDIIPEHSHCSLLELRFRFNDIEQLPSSIENLRKLVYIDLHSCRKLTSLPGSICGLRHLRNLKLYGCVLEKLPEDINKLESLEKLNLSFTCIKLLPESICKLKHLKTLNLSSCWNLEELPEDLGRIDFLQNLILTECIRVTNIPDSICELEHLNYLSVMGCIQLEKLPEELGRLKSLEELNLKDTLIRHLPQSISSLKDLKIYGPISGLQYRGYSSTSQTLEVSSTKKQKVDPNSK